jgi:hypothetical protein
MQFKLTLDEENVEAAILAHLKTLGVNTDGKNVNVIINSGRGSTGCSADLIVYDDGEAPASAEAPKKTQTRKQAPKLVPAYTEAEAEPVPLEVTKEEPASGFGKSLFNG